MNKTVKLEEDMKRTNKTYSYMLPLLCRELEVPNLLSLVNIFVKHEDYPDLQKHLFCVFKWNPNRIYTKFEDDLMKHPLCVFHKDISSQHYMICFSVNDNMKYDYDSFVKSQYSKISTEGKRTIISFFKLAKDHAVTMVLHKDARLKKKYEEVLGVRLDSDAELSSVLDLNGIETFKSSYIIESKSPLPKL